MQTQEIVGGVSPLKRRRTRHRAGTAGVRATRGGGWRGRRRRRGFSKAGARGVNVHGYSALTRFKPPKDYTGPLSKATAPKTGGSTSNGGGKGGDTYANTYNMGDKYDYSRHQNISDSFKGGAVTIGPAPITNKTDNTANLKQKQVVEQTSEGEGEEKTGGFREACYDENGKRLPEGSVGTDSKGKRFKCAWDPNWKPRGKGTKVKGKATGTQKGNVDATTKTDIKGHTYNVNTGVSTDYNPNAFLTDP